MKQSYIVSFKHPTSPKDDFVTIEASGFSQFKSREGAIAFWVYKDDGVWKVAPKTTEPKGVQKWFITQATVTQVWR